MSALPASLSGSQAALSRRAWSVSPNPLSAGPDAYLYAYRDLGYRASRITSLLTAKASGYTIDDFTSPTIIERLDSQDDRLFKAHVTDWRFMVDCVMIDPAYDGQTFNITLTDLPEKKADLVSGIYTLPAPKDKTTVAVKIVDMLGEEVMVSCEV